MKSIGIITLFATFASLALSWEPEDCGDAFMQKMGEVTANCVLLNQNIINAYGKLLADQITDYDKSKTYTLKGCNNTANQGEKADPRDMKVCAAFANTVVPCECSKAQCRREWLKANIKSVTKKDGAPAECNDAAKVCDKFKSMDSTACDLGVAAVKTIGGIKDETAVKNVFKNGCKYTCAGGNGVFPAASYRLQGIVAIITLMATVFSS